MLSYNFLVQYDLNADFRFLIYPESVKYVIDISLAVWFRHMQIQPYLVNS